MTTSIGSSDDVLQAIGIGDFEQTVYAAVLDHGPISVAEIARRVGTSPGRARRAVQLLEKKSLISGGARWSAVSPAVAMNVLIAQRQEQLERARLTVARWEERFRKRTVLRHPEDLIDVITDSKGVRQRFVQLQAAAQEEVLVVDKPPYAAPPEYGEPEFEGISDRGVRYRTIYDKTALEYEGRLEGIRRSIIDGEEAAVHPEVPMKFAVFDREMGMIALARDLPLGLEGVLMVHPCSLLDALVALWQLLWEGSTPIGVVGDEAIAQEPSHAVGSETDAQIITMLLGGLKAQAIARHLGLGKSTVDRRIARILERLGAETRFQAGYRFAEIQLGAREGSSPER